jgi:hypothetical protein
MYSEYEIIKFGKGNELAIRVLKSVDDDVKISHPMGFGIQNHKLMKLITRSQFLFQNQSQLRNFERTNQLGKLDKLSDKLLTLRFWRNVSIEDLKPFGVTELRDTINYREWSKNHSIGLGFEVLTYLKKHNGSLESVRRQIFNKINKGVKDFNAALNIDKCLEIAFKPDSENYRYLQLMFAAITVLRANEMEDLKNNLVKSAKNPTMLTVQKSDIVTLGQLLYDD